MAIVALERPGAHRSFELLHESDSEKWTILADVLLMNILERYRGSLLGLAVGDALGTTLEFEAPGTFEPIEEIEGGGPFSLARGQWTDDTSMALCLAESLITTATFDPADQMSRYLRWYLRGHHEQHRKMFRYREHGTARIA